MVARAGPSTATELAVMNTRLASIEEIVKEIQQQERTQNSRLSSDELRITILETKGAVEDKNVADLTISDKATQKKLNEWTGGGKAIYALLTFVGIDTILLAAHLVAK